MSVTSSATKTIVNTGLENKYINETLADSKQTKDIHTIASANPTSANPLPLPPFANQYIPALIDQILKIKNANPNLKILKIDEARNQQGVNLPHPILFGENNQIYAITDFLGQGLSDRRIKYDPPP